MTVKNNTTSSTEEKKSVRMENVYLSYTTSSEIFVLTCIIDTPGSYILYFHCYIEEWLLIDKDRYKYLFYRLPCRCYFQTVIVLKTKSAFNIVFCKCRNCTLRMDFSISIFHSLHAKLFDNTLISSFLFSLFTYLWKCLLVIFLIWNNTCDVSRYFFPGNNRS